jgi:hypothetical protein
MEPDWPAVASHRGPGVANGSDSRGQGYPALLHLCSSDVRAQDGQVDTSTSSARQRPPSAGLRRPDLLSKSNRPAIPAWSWPKWLHLVMLAGDGFSAVSDAAHHRHAGTPAFLRFFGLSPSANSCLKPAVRSPRIYHGESRIPAIVGICASLGYGSRTRSLGLPGGLKEGHESPKRRL